MKRQSSIIFAIIFSLTLCAVFSPVHAEEIIGSASAEFEIEAAAETEPPGAEPVKPDDPGDAAKKPDEPIKWKVKEVKVIRVINRDGNNPLMPEEPVFNEDGQLVAENDEDDGGGDAGNGGGGCAGKSAMYVPSATGREGQASLGYDPADGFCDVRGGLVFTDQRMFSVIMYPADGNPTKPWISLSASNSSFWGGDGGGYWENVVQGQILVFTAKHMPSGVTYQFTVKVDVTMNGSVTLLGIVKQ